MKKYLFLIIASIFIIPLSGVLPLRGQPVWYGQYLGLLFMLLFSISLFLWNFNKWLSIFTFICLGSTFFIAKISPRALILLFQLDLACLASYGISRLPVKYHKYILYSLFGLILIQTIWIILQFFNLDFIFSSLKRPGKDEIVGFSGASNQLGTFFALTTPFSIYIFPPLVIMNIIGLVLAKSSFAFISALGGSIVYILNQKLSRKRILLVSFLIILSMAIFFIKGEKIKAGDFPSRLFVWKYAALDTLKGKCEIEKFGNKIAIGCNPLFGFGFGNFQLVFPFRPPPPREGYFNTYDEHFTHAHNDYVEVFFEMGKLGIFSLGFLLLMFIYNFYKSKKSKLLILYFSSIIVWLLNASGNFLSQLAVSGMFLIIFYGLYESERKKLNGDFACLV